MQDKISKLQAFDLNYFRGKNHFEEEGTQNTDISKRLLVFVVVIIFIFANLKICLIKVLNLLITFNYSITSESSYFGT